MPSQPFRRKPFGFSCPFRRGLPLGRRAPEPCTAMACAAAAAKAPAALNPPGDGAAATRRPGAPAAGATAAIAPTDANVAAFAVRLADAASSLGKHVMTLSETATTVAAVMTETHRLVGVVADLAGDYSMMHTT